MRYRLWAVVVVMSMLAGVRAGRAQNEDAEPTVVPETSDSVAEIETAVKSYVAAFNSRDAGRLAAHWSAEAVYISRSSGEELVGREALEADFAAIFSGDSGATLALASESIELISPNVALERGVATVSRSAEDIAVTEYDAVYVKRDGEWLIDRVTERDVVASSPHYENLKELEWLVGDWHDEGEGYAVDISCAWTKNQNFISRTYKVSNGDAVESSGLQVIGWDAKQKAIRSWLFDSDGGFIGGTWTKRDDRWVVQSVATLADGGNGSFTSVFRPLEDGTYGWQKINQVVDGQLLPNVDEIIVQRR